MNAAEIRVMNTRVAARWAAVNLYPRIPVTPPSWAGAVLDAGEEILAVHKDTGAPYPLDLHNDFDPEDRAVVIVRRILAEGGTARVCKRFLKSFSLPAYVFRRLSRQLEEATR